tara:strand:+ start:6124 stop:6855 length:732 start_codon:yes stop_codon:yes gene_type:complete
VKLKNSNKTYQSFRRIHGFEGEFRSYTTHEIFTTETPKNQRVKILKVSDGVGLCLEINDDLMALEVNQDFLHEQMVKLGVSNLNTKPRNIVVLGGGDGGILKHCLKVKPRSVKVLELEEEMVQICKKYLPHISEGAFEDSKAKMIYGNAFDTIKKIRKNSQHLFFIDMADCASDVENQTFGKKYESLFLNINRCLKDGGVVVCQASGYQKQILSTFKKFFKNSYGWTDSFELQHANSFVYATK